MTIEKLKGILTEFKDFDQNAVNESTTFAEIGLDSLDVVDLVMKIHEETGTEIPLSAGLKNLGDVLDYLNKAAG